MSEENYLESRLQDLLYERESRLFLEEFQKKQRSKRLVVLGFMLLAMILLLSYILIRMSSFQSREILITEYYSFPEIQLSRSAQIDLTTKHFEKLNAKEYKSTIAIFESESIISDRDRYIKSCLYIENGQNDTAIYNLQLINEDSEYYQESIYLLYVLQYPTASVDDLKVIYDELDFDMQQKLKDLHTRL